MGKDSRFLFLSSSDFIKNLDNMQFYKIIVIMKFKLFINVNGDRYTITFYQLLKKNREMTCC